MPPRNSPRRARPARSPHPALRRGGRAATVSRDTRETQITVALDLDGTGRVSLDTGVPFLDHMLDQVGRHGLVDLEVNARGDLHKIGRAHV